MKYLFVSTLLLVPVTSLYTGSNDALVLKASDVGPTPFLQWLFVLTILVAVAGLGIVLLRMERATRSDIEQIADGITIIEVHDTDNT